MVELKLLYDSCLESEEQMLEEVEAFLEQIGVDFLESRPILVSISEAFTNALIHGNKQDSSKSIQVMIRLTDDTIEAEVTDEGTGAIVAINSRQSVDESSENGRGMDVIEHYAKETRLTETENGGLKVFMAFSRNKQGKIESQL